MGEKGGDGVLIHPDWVLTAAHVADGLFQKKEGELSVYFGDKSIKVNAIFLHPDFFGSDDKDIALLQLDRSVTEFEPIPLYSLRDENGKEIVVVGHGDKLTTEGVWLKGGVKRGFTNRIDEVNHDYIIFNYDSPADNPTKLEWTCGPGDSGGPALILENGNYHVVGISSKGMPGKQGKCTYGAKEFFVRVSSHLNWVNNVMATPESFEKLQYNKPDETIPPDISEIITTIVSAFENFSDNLMIESIEKTYAKAILNKKSAKDIMQSMPIMMKELKNAKLEKLVSQNSTKAVLLMIKDNTNYHLEIFFHPLEKGKIEQLAFGKTN
ncbi:MAG TPA: trypsin-like serine protease [Saprospiraceae bacterium]|nr:trypsin-like serine protease [Saprospiraceae bacterium]